MSKTPSNPTEQPLKDFITIAQVVEMTGFSRQHIGLLLRTKKLPGVKIGRNWVTTEAAVREYLATERRPGPKVDEE